MSPVIFLDILSLKKVVILNSLWKNCKFYVFRIYNVGIMRPIEEKCYLSFRWIRVLFSGNESNLFTILNPPQFFNFFDRFCFIRF